MFQCRRVPPAVLTRRAVLGVAASAAALAARPRAARAAKRISFTLPWIPEGANMVAYIAKENGYWSYAGLDVDVSRGSGSVTAAQAIGAGRFDFGLSVASAGLQQAAKGLPVVQIACCSYDAMMGVAVRRDGPLHTPKDLEGHTVASTTSSGEYPFLSAFAAKAGVDYDKIKHVAADPNVRNSMFVQDKVDGVSGLAPTLMPTFSTLGRAHPDDAVQPGRAVVLRQHADDAGRPAAIRSGYGARHHDRADEGHAVRAAAP